MLEESAGSPSDDGDYNPRDISGEPENSDEDNEEED
jgi:hypothetical protein